METSKSETESVETPDETNQGNGNSSSNQDTETNPNQDTKAKTDDAQPTQQTSEKSKEIDSSQSSSKEESATSKGDDTVAGDKSEAEVKAEKIEAKTLTIAGTIEDKSTTIITSNFLSQKEIIPEELSLKHFSRFKVEKIELSVEEDKVKRITEVFTKQNLLFLAGEPEVGKATIARLIAFQLSQQNDLSQVLFSLNMDKKIIVKIDQIASKKEYKQTVIIFKDAFASKHDDLINFVKELELKFKSISDQLRENQIFIIFTSDLEVMKTHEMRLEKLKQLGILHEIAVPNSKILAQGLHQQIEQFIHSQLPNDSGKAEYLRQCLTDENANITNTLDTMPRIVRFIEEYSWQIVEKQFTVEQALEQFDNIDFKTWFFKELTTDFEAWCFALTLILSYPSSDFYCRPVQFYQFQRRVLKFLNTELLSEKQRKELETILPPDDDTLLQKTRAEVKRLSYPFADIIQFRDVRYPEQLWKVLVESGKGVLTLLVPLLKKLAIDNDLYLQESAAKALGRVGEMDRYYISFPLISEWLGSEEESHHVAVGYLFQGILGSTDQSYHQDCLGELRGKMHYLLNKGNVRPGILVLLMIGYVNLELSMGELKRIVQNKFKNVINDLKTHNEELQILENLFREKRSDIKRLQHNQLFQMIAIEVFSKTEVQILMVIQSCMEALSSYHDFIQIMEELLHWMKEEPKNIAPLLGLLFTRSGGIADELENGRITKTNDKEAEKQQENASKMESRILLEASRNEQSTQVLIQFLEQVFVSLSAFPNFFRRPLQSIVVCK